MSLLLNKEETMKLMRYISAFLLVAICFSSPLGYAAEGDSNFTNVVASGDITAGDDVTANEGDFTGDVTTRSTLVTIGRVNAILEMPSSSTLITGANVPYALILKNVGGTGLDDTDGGARLANGKPGATLTIFIKSISGGSGDDFIVTPITKTGFTLLTFDAIKEYATLLYVDDTIGWIVQSASAGVVSN